MGGDFGHPHQIARRRKDEHELHHPGGYALLQAAQLISKARRAGVKRVFIGLENINPDSLMGAPKTPEQITDYRQMLLEWKKAVSSPIAVTSWASPRHARIHHSRIEIIKRELPVDLLEFFYLRPCRVPKTTAACTNPAWPWTRI